MTTNIGVARSWRDATTSQTSKSGNGNMSHVGHVLYSYGTPIAHWVWNGSKPVYLITSDSYSVTTEGKHKNAARKAVNYKAFHVPYLLLPPGTPKGRMRPVVDGALSYQHQGNLEHYRKVISEEVARLGRARGDKSTEYLHQLQDEEHQYRTVFDLWDVEA